MTLVDKLDRLLMLQGERVDDPTVRLNHANEREYQTLLAEIREALRRINVVYM
jgi:hypothetical protein